jgi:hypothetical protein
MFSYNVKKVKNVKELGRYITFIQEYYYALFEANKYLQFVEFVLVNNTSDNIQLPRRKEA